MVEFKQNALNENETGNPLNKSNFVELVHCLIICLLFKCFFRKWNECNLISWKINRVTPTKPLWTNSANRDQRDAIDMLLQRVHTEITKTTCYCFWSFKSYCVLILFHVLQCIGLIGYFCMSELKQKLWQGIHWTVNKLA